MDYPRQLIPFNLTERNGRPVTDAQVAGKILVVDFVFTSCSLTCRAVNDRMAEIPGLHFHPLSAAELLPAHGP